MWTVNAAFILPCTANDDVCWCLFSVMMKSKHLHIPQNHHLGRIIHHHLWNDNGLYNPPPHWERFMNGPVEQCDYIVGYLNSDAQ